MKNNVFTAYTSAVKKISARPDPFADTETAPEPTKITETRKPEKHWGFAAYACAMLAVVCLVTAGVFGFLRSVTKDSPSSSGIEAEDVPDPPFPVYRDNLQIIKPADGIYDRVYIAPSEVLTRSDLIFIGEYLDDPTRDHFDRSNQITGNYTVNDLKILKIFKGDHAEGDTVEVYQNYTIKNKELNGRPGTVINVGYSGYVPMYKGDKAIFVLKYDDYTMKAYQVAYRFPLPENKNKEDRLGFKNGVLNEMIFDQELYNEILNTYGLGTDPEPGNTINALNLNIIWTKPEYTLMTPEEAVEKADMIIIGEYLDSLENTPETIYGSGLKDIRSTYNKIKVKKVLKGDVSANDTLTVIQNYKYERSGLENNNNDPEKRDRLYVNSLFVPMYKGDEAIFLLTYDEESSDGVLKPYRPIELYGRYPYDGLWNCVDRLGFRNSIVYSISEEDKASYNELYIYLWEKYGRELTK